MTELSPAAQAVLDAAHEAWITKDDAPSIAAAALRAAADQVVPDEPRPPDTPDFPDDVTIGPFYEWLERRDIRRKLLASAAELDGATTTSENN
jgi:hypothetical protein